MQRDRVLQGFLDLFKTARYLEIGVDAGVTFHALGASHRVAVDPQFRFDVPEPRVTPTREYHEVPSDVYFGSRSFDAPKFDVIYLDGLHTFEQILRDLLNAIECLADEGVIVIDDVLPTTFTSSLPNEDDVVMIRALVPSEAADESWMGDVYRVVFFVATFMQGWQFATIQENHGQLVMWRSPRPAVDHPDHTVARLGTMDLVAMFRQRTEFKITPYAHILSDYRSAMENRKKRIATPRPAGSRVPWIFGGGSA